MITGNTIKTAMALAIIVVLGGAVHAAPPPPENTSILSATRIHWGVLDREIVSSLPGLIIVRLDEDVFSTDGLTKILEKGDAWVGRYEPLEKIGDDRLNICFFRIVRLGDGAHIYKDGDCLAYATDAMGRAGLVGDVDTRLWEKYGSAQAITGLSALIENNIDLAPVITITAGERVGIQLLRDLYVRRGEPIEPMKQEQPE